jgi:selenocysteine-specific elongation factor
MSKLIGTGGHVDHGKTTLIRALTGIDADRLPEEQQRGMTIDVGFAYIDLPDIGRVSIVDVPGHEKFITNMLVGALGIDVALLCVAADEAVKPQTREHLQIFELLPIEKMVVALTRCDLADRETRDLAQLDIEQLLESTRFKGSTVIEVSAETGEGLDDLKTCLTKALAETVPEPPGPWYLPIDRVFVVRGHGCVVTGTLARGDVAEGETAYLEPGHREVRIRAIHSHGEPQKSGENGRRIALNLSGIKADEVERGQAIGAPGALFETTSFDADITWVGEHKHGQRVRVSVGADEAIGKVFLSDNNDQIAQFRLEKTIACALNQPIIIRRYSPPDVLGGGRVVVPQAVKRRKSETVETTAPGVTDEQAILQLLEEKRQGVPTDELCRALGKTPQLLGNSLERLLHANKVHGFAGLWFTQAEFNSAAKDLLRILQEMHESRPAVSAIPREQVVQAAGLKWSGKPLDRILSSLEEEGKLQVAGSGIRLPSFRVLLSPKQRVFLDRVVEALENAGVNTPQPKELARILTVPPQAIDEILKLGIQSGDVVRIEDGMFYGNAQIAKLKETIKAHFGSRRFSASEFRDLVGSSRKYAIPLLEYMDSIRFTLRVGDERVVKG